MPNARPATWRDGALLALVAALAAWLWPIGLGGRMPLGGDVTQFSIGLMAGYQRALRAGRLPLWNDLWGYGFPGLAESQMGVFYPPHWVLYGLLPLEAAYTANLVLHTFWGGVGAFWAARRFEVSRWGAALAGLAWAASGFFLIHLPHHWAATTGSWMPWAWGLGWMVLSGRGCWRTTWNLAIVLAVQLLPGHFQLAFCTQVGLLVMAAWAVAERPAGRPAAVRHVACLAAALAAVALLDAMQLWPTLRLAQQASSRRDFEYLSGFAIAPVHAVSFLAPGLFHRSPLWRPVAWNPLHTSPEEHLAYIGLAPLFLAVGAGLRGWKRDPAVRLLVVLAAVSLLLGLGPYAPGFALWSRWPGFSFFRAPARWGLAAELALAMLAGKGLDALVQPADWPRAGRSLVRFVFASAAAIVLVVLAFELALASTEGRGWPEVASGFDRLQRLLPWSGDPSFRQVMAAARRPQADDLRVRAGQARERFPFDPAQPPRLSEQRYLIYAKELGETAAVLAGLLALAPLARRRHALAAGLLLLTAFDLVCLGRHRTVDLGPIRPLTAQSAVLARLAQAPAGTRLLASTGNLPMVARVAPVAAFRTLDLPALDQLTALANAPFGRPETDPLIVPALRAAGIRLRLVEDHPALRQALTALGEGPPERVLDPALAAWSFGADWVATAEGSQSRAFLLWGPHDPPVRAWSVPAGPGRSPAELAANNGDPRRVLSLVRAATPAALTVTDPEHLVVHVKAPGPGVVVISQLAYPGWEARWEGSGGTSAEVVRVLGGWQAVAVPAATSGTLHLAYPGREERRALGVSGVAWTVAVVAFWWQQWGRRRWRKHPRPQRDRSPGKGGGEQP